MSEQVKMVIWKYGLASDQNLMEMPKGARILAAGAQGGNIVLWALVNPTARLAGRRVYTVVTGEQFQSRGAYVGTATTNGGIVVHVFDEGETT